jgi:hypothetical protein
MTNAGDSIKNGSLEKYRQHRILLESSSANTAANGMSVGFS